MTDITIIYRWNKLVPGQLHLLVLLAKEKNNHPMYFVVEVYDEDNGKLNKT